MCGILSYYNNKGISKKDLKECLSSLKRIKHRGPDGEGGILIDTKIGKYQILKTDETPFEIRTDINIEEYKEFSADLFLGHRRLSIFDLSINGHQPMFDKQTGNWIIYNGEIYNFIELRQNLEKKGICFKSKTDTELILKYYALYGKEGLIDFNGMWAFVLWDNQKKQLFISRDRFGVKPLFYFKDNDKFILVSEQKQFFDFKNINLEYNKIIVNNFIETGFIFYDKETFYENIYRFHPATYSYFNPQNQESKQDYYYKLSLQKKNISEENAVEEFSDIFSDAVDIRTRADVDWGVGLSGGLDSSAVIYSIYEQIKNTKQTVKSFSSISPGRAEDESKFIKFIEKDLNIDSFYIDALQIFNIEDFKNFLYHLDTPTPGTSFYAQWKVAELVKQNNITVLLVGQGADEIFGGYHQHFHIYATQLIKHGKIIKYINFVKNYAELKQWNFYKLHLHILKTNINLTLLFKWHLSKISKNLSKKWYSIHDLSKALRTDLEEFQIPFFLHADDHSGMAFSLETRHPFMDYRLIDFAFSLPDEYKMKNGWQKYIIRKASKNMPDFIKYRKDKKGFSTPQKEIIEILKEEFKIKNQLSDKTIFYKIWKNLININIVK